MPTYEESIFAKANYIVSLINLIDTLNQISSIYSVSTYYNIETRLKSENASLQDEAKLSELKPEDKAEIDKMTTDVRVIATNIYYRILALPDEYVSNKDKISETYSKLFSKVIIHPEDLKNFVIQVNQCYYNIAKALDELRKKFAQMW